MKKIFFIALALFLSLCTVSASAQANTAISKGKDYELVTPANTAYPDTEAKKLTDGAYAKADSNGSYFQEPEYVAFNNTNFDTKGNVVIVLDLGSVATDISKFEISYLNQADAGISAPVNLSVSVSDVRNGTYTDVGTIAIEAPTETTAVSSKAVVTPSGAISGKYVMFTISAKTTVDTSGNTIPTGWIFLDEISVYGVSDTSGTVPQTGDDNGLILYLIVTLSTVVIIGNVILKKRLKEPK